MQTLPDELILEILNVISDTKDKRSFIRTCKTYHNITKHEMSKIKYVISKGTYDLHGAIYYKFWCICDTLIDFRNCLHEYLDKQTNTDYEIIKERDDFMLRGCIMKHRFVIEETIINDINHYIKN